MIGTIENAELAAAHSASLETILGVIDELIGVIDEENRVLSSGMPASLTPVLQRKGRLGDALHALTGEGAATLSILAKVEPVEREELVARITALRARMDENLTRLRAAMEASRRRVDAIMAAVREDAASKSPYGADGRAFATSRSNRRGLGLQFEA